MSGPVPELSRLVPVERVGARGLVFEVAATDAEREAVAGRLGVPAITALTCRFSLSRPGGHGTAVSAEAELSAGVVQVCVVTLEPFEARVRECGRLRFVPAGQESADDDPESDDEIPYDGVAIDLGEAAVEQLALALDPFPRSPGASLPDMAPEDAANPFAVLAGRGRPH